MGNENKFWLGFWATAVAGIVSFTFIIADYEKDYDTKLAKLIAQGADPLALTCAFKDHGGNNPVCVALASKTNGE